MLERKLRDTLSVKESDGSNRDKDGPDALIGQRSECALYLVKVTDFHRDWCDTRSSGRILNVFDDWRRIWAAPIHEKPEARQVGYRHPKKLELFGSSIILGTRQAP